MNETNMDSNADNADRSSPACDEKNRLLFLRQKKMPDMFPERDAISQTRHDKSLHDLTGEMRMNAEVDSNDD